jgi:hypothetical protein
VGWEIKVIQVDLNSLGWGLITKRLIEIEPRKAITSAEASFRGSGLVVVRDEPREDGARKGLRPGQQIPKIFVKRAMAMFYSPEKDLLHFRN